MAELVVSVNSEALAANLSKQTNQQSSISDKQAQVTDIC
ncbi:mCG148198 [Mus musculus]|jgi:hypothetical protein|uniref:cDNA sequence BC002189 n=1 Tax=Mus musculus TaxID=10090 RepID=Q99LW8_MOUSE|nr:CDNA sequence BC002189 [Mus musculus]EDL34880.1 mCG148198 [Mus musculus]